MNIDNFKNVKTLNDIKNMIAFSDWKIYQIIREQQIIMLSPDDRYYLTITTDLLNSASNKIMLFDRDTGRSQTNEQRIKNNGYKDLYNLVRSIYYGVTFK